MATKTSRTHEKRATAVPGQDDPAEIDVRALVRGKSVAFVGKLASMTREQFADVVASFGGQYSHGPGLGAAAHVVVLGQENLPLTRDGDLLRGLRMARVMQRRGGRRITVLPEEQFLAGLGLESHREHVRRLYTTAMLTAVLDVSRDSVRAWVRAGLISPVATVSGVWQFDFQQVSAAKTLCELSAAGISPGKLRRSLNQLRRWMPEAHSPLQQLALLQGDGRILLRVGDGELAETTGQLQLFSPKEQAAEEPDTAPFPMRLGPPPPPEPHDAAEWRRQGLEQELDGYLDEAAESYRQALLSGGPDAQTCFDLALVLSNLGKKPEAAERYRQAIEIDPRYADAWNNLGDVLADLGQLDEACAAFRRALGIDATDMRANYNLADTLDRLGRNAESAPYWRAYLKSDTTSPWAARARKRLAVS
jgi:tetratricopeptide (TPR) repeat protein